MSKTQLSYQPRTAFRSTIAIAGFSITQLAAAAGVSSDTLTKIISRNRVSPKVAAKIAHTLAPRLQRDPMTVLGMLFENTDGTPIATPAPLDLAPAEIPEPLPAQAPTPMRHGRKGHRKPPE